MGNVDKREAVRRSPRPSIDEMIVVEGVHDKQKVDLAVQADVIVLGGDRIGKRMLDVIQRARNARGVIVFTDPDGAGERIRRRIDAVVPGCKHAYLTRQQATGGTGLGVEYATVEDVLAALFATRSTMDDVAESTGGSADEAFTQSDLLAEGLTGAPDSAAKRAQLGDALGIGYGNSKAFLRKLNTLHVTRDEFARALERLRCVE